MQKVSNYAVRRAMGMDLFNMKEHSVKDIDLVAAARWETIGTEVRRTTLQWLGHVARMPIHRRPKQMLNGWLVLPQRMRKYWGEPQASWLRDALRRAEMSQIDWFRKAQDRRGWRTAVAKAFPKQTTEKKWEEKINAWRPGGTLPARPAG